MNAKYVAVLALGSLVMNHNATGSVVLFDNSAANFVLFADGSFPTPQSILDPTLSPMAQASAVASRSFVHVAAVGGGSESPNSDALVAGSNIRIVRSTVPVVITNAFGVQTTFRPAHAFLPGDLVGDAANYQSSASLALFYLGGGAVHQPFLPTETFVGFRVNLSDGPHFGWIQLSFRTGPLSTGGSLPMYQPVRWAYETEPNVPITVVPAPAGAAVLASIGLFVARRRRGG